MNWPLVKIGQVADINPRLPKHIDETQEVTFLGMASVSEDGKLLSEEFRTLSETKKGFTYFSSKDVLLAKITPCFENGKCLRPSQISREVGFGSTEFHVVRAQEGKLEANYLFYMLWSGHFRFNGKHAMSGAAGQKRVSADFIRGYEIPLPPLAEQKRIAAILDKADNLRRKRQQAIQLADDFLRSVFLDMFGDPVTNPKGWEVVEIEKVCTDIVDCINKTAKTVDYETPYKMIRTTNVRDYKIDLSGVRFAEFEVYKKWVSRLLSEKGDIVFTREAPAGEVGIVDADDLVFLGQRTMQFRPNYKRVNSTYLLYEMMGGGIKRQMDKMSSGSTVKHLSVPECKKFKVRVPELALQDKFEEISKKVSELVKTSKGMHEIPFFNSLSQKAFAGEL